MGAVWGLEPAASSGYIGIGYGWWRAQGATTGRLSRDSRGVTQGVPQSPTIFNVVVDAVV